MRREAIVAGAIFAALGLAQVVPVSHHNPAGRASPAAPEDVERVLHAACFDCHSNETRWPWYSRVAPVSWWVVHDVSEAREQLNFSDWPKYSPQVQERLLHRAAAEVGEGDMPPWGYTAMHPEARLSSGTRRALVEFFAGYRVDVEVGSRSRMPLRVHPTDCTR